MFRITEDPSPGSLLVECLVKNYKNDSIGHDRIILVIFNQAPYKVP